MRCPVCGYPSLPEHAMNHGICPSCGTEFGYDDFTRSHSELRTKWLRSGAEWFDDHTPRPRNWDPLKQVIDAFSAAHLIASEPIRDAFRADIPVIPVGQLVTSKPISSAFRSNIRVDLTAEAFPIAG